MKQEVVCFWRSQIHLDVVVDFRQYFEETTRHVGSRCSGSSEENVKRLHQEPCGLPLLLPGDFSGLPFVAKMFTDLFVFIQIYY